MSISPFPRSAPTSRDTPTTTRRPRWLRILSTATIGAGIGVALASQTGPFSTSQLRELRARRDATTADTIHLARAIDSLTFLMRTVHDDPTLQERLLRGYAGYAKPEDRVYRLMIDRPGDTAPTNAAARTHETAGDHGDPFDGLLPTVPPRTPPPRPTTTPAPGPTPHPTRP